MIYIKEIHNFDLDEDILFSIILGISELPQFELIRVPLPGIKISDVLYFNCDSQKNKRPYELNYFGNNFEHFDIDFENSQEPPFTNFIEINANLSADITEMRLKFEILVGNLLKENDQNKIDILKQLPELKQLVAMEARFN